MLAKRLRMLSVFAGGCLSGSVLIVMWRGDVEPSASSPRRAETPSEPAVATAPDEGQHAAEVDAPSHEEAAPADPTLPAAPKAAEHGADPAEPGRAITDVLAHLEAAYRQKLAEASPSTDTPAEAAAPASAVSDARSREAPIAPPETATLAQAPSREPPSVALAAVAAPAGPAASALVASPVADARTPAAPVAAPMPAAQSPAPPAANPTVAAAQPVGVAPQIGVVPQNVHIGDTHNGNTYNVQQVIQYVPMYAPWAYGAYVPPAVPTPRSGGQKRVPYPSTLTNPDNPWGYDFPSALWTVR